METRRNRLNSVLHQKHLGWPGADRYLSDSSTSEASWENQRKHLRKDIVETLGKGAEKGTWVIKGLAQIPWEESVQDFKDGECM